MYVSNQNIKQDLHKAKKLFNKACNGNYSQGCYDLGVMYMNGVAGIKQDYTKAEKLFAKACKSNNHQGCYNLGFMYANGLGMSRNKDKAYKLWVKAFKNGNPVAKQSIVDLCREDPMVCK